MMDKKSRALWATSLTAALAVPVASSTCLAVARQDAGCLPGANHVTATSSTNDIFTALSVAASGGAPLTALATDMSAASLGLLGANGPLVAPNGVFGTYFITPGLASGASSTVLAGRISSLLSRTCVDATVTADAANLNAAAMTAVCANIAKVDRITNLPASSVLSFRAEEISGVEVRGAGTIAVRPDAVTQSADLTSVLTTVTFPASVPFLAVTGAGSLRVRANQVHGTSVAGDGTIEIEGDVAASTDFTALAPALDFNADGTDGLTVAAGAELRLTAAQASGKRIAGAGTVRIVGAVGAACDLTGIATALVIEGEVLANAVLTLTAEQAHGRSVQGAGTVAISAATSARTSDTDFRGIATAGLAFNGSIAAGRTLAIRAEQQSITVAGDGTVEILGTEGEDAIAPATISAPLRIIAAEGDDGLTGGARGDLLEGGAGDDAIDGAAGTDRAAWSGTLAAATLAQSDASTGAPTGAPLAVASAGEGIDAVRAVEWLDFSDASVIVVGHGSSVATLDDALAMSGNPRIFGHLAITAQSFQTAAGLDALLARIVAGSSLRVDASGMSPAQRAAVAASIGAGTGITQLTLNHEDSAATIGLLLSRSGSGFASVALDGMDRAQIAAVNAHPAAVASISGTLVRVIRGAQSTTVWYDRFVDSAVAAASAGDRVEVAAGQYTLESPLALAGIVLAGAGATETVLDGSALAAEAVAVASGSGARLSGVRLHATSRPQGSAIGGLRAGTGCSGLVVEDCGFDGLGASAIVLEGATDATVARVAIAGVSAGPAVLIRGATEGVAIGDLSIAGGILHAVEIAASPADPAAHPSGVQFLPSATLDFNAIVLRHGAAELVASVPAGNAGARAGAHVAVPAAFNRAHRVASPFIEVLSRQTDVAAVDAALTADGVAGAEIVNTLGPVELVRGGVAIAGRAMLDDALAAMLAAGDQLLLNDRAFIDADAAAGGVVLSAALPEGITIEGSFTLTHASFAEGNVLASILAASPLAARTVDLAFMGGAQVAMVAARLEAIGAGNILHAVHALNIAGDAVAMHDALRLSALVPHAGYEALTAARRAAVSTDLVTNRAADGYPDVAAAGALLGLLVDHRAAEQAILDGSPLVAADFATNGRYARLAARWTALPANTVLSGETADLARSPAILAQFNALAADGRGRAHVLAAMQSAGAASMSARNAAFAAAFETAKAFDALDRGITSAQTALEISYLLAFSAAFETKVDAHGMTTAQLGAVASGSDRIASIANLVLTNAQSGSEIGALLSRSIASAAADGRMARVDATAMDAAKLSAIATHASRLEANGITGNVLLPGSLAESALGALLPRIAPDATARLDGNGLGNGGIALVVAHIGRVDSAFALSLSASQTAAELGLLLGLSDLASASVDATAMDSASAGQLAALADHHARIRDGGISGALAIDSRLAPLRLTRILAKLNLAIAYTGPTTVAIDATGMSDDHLRAIAAAVAAIEPGALRSSTYDIANLSLTASLSAAEMRTLLEVTLASEADVLATGMSLAQLAAVADHAAGVQALRGTLALTADLTATQLAALVGRAAAGTRIDVDPRGMDQAQRAALVLAPTVHVSLEGLHSVGDLVFVDVDVHALPAPALGAQMRVLYDASRLALVLDVDGDGYNDSVGGTDMPTQVYVQQQPGQVTFATGVDIGGNGQGVISGNIARLAFRVIAGACDVGDLVSLATTGFNARLSASSGASIPFSSINLSRITVMTPPVLAGVPETNVAIPTDAGSLVGASVAEPIVTAANNCTTTPVTRHIVLADGSTAPSWPARFPIGTSSVTWSTVDPSGNTAAATRTVTVHNHQIARLAVEMAGVISAGAPFTRPVRVSTPLSAPVVLDVEFNGPASGTVEVQLPVRESYPCLGVKGTTHTLATSQTPAIDGTVYAFATAFRLTSGDSNDDNAIDILDFGELMVDRSVVGSEPKTPNSRSNYDGNAFVNNVDFAFIATGFLRRDESCSQGAAGAEPLARISVKDARRRGMGHLVVADVNGDGWIDARDMQLLLEGGSGADGDGAQLPDAGDAAMGDGAAGSR